MANLSKGKISHDKANPVGSLLTRQFQLAAMRRANQSEEEHRDFYLFIDEFPQKCFRPLRYPFRLEPLELDGDFWSTNPVTVFISSWWK
jgi:hypothetical protein